MGWSGLGVSGLLPTGTVTLLMGDVEDSAQLSEIEPERMAVARALLNDTLTQVTAAHDGVSVGRRDGDGFVDKDGKNLELDFVFYSGRAELPLYAEATQSDAKKVGIKINLKNVDYNVLDGIGVRGEYDLLISNILTEQAGDPEVFVNQYWKTNVDGSNPQNGSGYSNPEYDALSDQLASEFDPAKRRDIIIKMEKIVQDDAATLIFGYPQTNMVSNKSVQNANIYPCDYYWVTKDITPAK